MKSMILSTLLLSLSAVTGFTTQTPSGLIPSSLYSTTESSSSPTPPTQTPSQETKQPEYGVSLELPGTYVRCGRCATSYAIAEEDLGGGRGRRIECGLCGHSWFQTPDRLFTLNNGHELVKLPETEVDRIESNIKNGRDPDFKGNLKFYVGNLDFGVGEDELRELFAGVGEVGGIDIVTGPDGRSKGFAFVTMISDEVKDACMDLHGTELLGRSINVKEPNN